MSRRTAILKTLSEAFKAINGSPPYNINLYDNAYPYLKFWDELNQFPALYSSPGTELREYLPGGFKWGYLNISIKAYVKGDDATDQLEKLLEDIETVIDANQQLIYDVDNNYETTELTIQSITTDEGLLAPYGVGEINVQVRYQIM